ncbi:PREDICTED: cytochrome c oxidase subunit 7C, mitochondrial [Nipponia nippon]|nr:PREDICTED: cytochrome c oxidase subunit 7C, mitochondrial [Nipponia nippon]
MAKRIVVQMISVSFPATFCFSGTDDEHRSMRGNNDTNLPFSVDNKWRLLVLMCGFFGSGFVAPFVIVRHQLLKK